MRNKKKVRVNPRKDKEGNVYNAYDGVGRKIKWKEEGNLVLETMIVRRQLKTGDLLLVKEPEENTKPSSPELVKQEEDENKKSDKKTSKKDKEVAK